jgi:hypothetical protein
MWAHSGREIFYQTSNLEKMMVAAVETGEGTFRVLERSPLFDLPAGTSTSPLSTPYDISPDDQEFIMVRAKGAAPEAEQPPLILVENWLEELKARMGSQGG